MPFREVIGHRRLVTLLSRAIAHETLPPSLLFAGPRRWQAADGSGRRRDDQLSRTASRARCCRATHAESARRAGVSRAASIPDVLIVEPGDLGSIKIEQVRDVVDRAGYRPFEGRRRVVIIDEADAMVDAAQNALLKTLEEPPSASVFMLVSSMPDALLPTVLSRCPRCGSAAAARRKSRKR